jgi:ribosome-associated heat shock protein Hsp15
MTGTRIDKWLWAARFFKTRTLAARACELGRVEANRQLVIRTEGGEFEVEVLLLAEMRGPASVAQTLYRETDESKEARRKASEERRAFMHYTPAPAKRPSKRDRRKIHKFREDL